MSNRWAVAILSLFTVLLQSLCIGEFSTPADEGLVLTVADRIAGGEILYRDVDVVLPPLVPTFFALCFLIFGTSAKTAALGLAIVRSTNVALVYWLSRKVAKPTPSLLVSLSFLACYALEPSHANYHFSANIPYLCLTGSLINWSTTKQPGWLAAVGFFLATTALTIHTYFIIAIVLVLCTIGKDGLHSRNLGTLLMGFSPPVLLFSIFLTVQGSWLACYDCLILGNAYRMQYEYLTFAQALRCNYSLIQIAPLQAVSFWLPLLLSLLLPALKPKDTGTKVLLAAHILLLLTNAPRLHWLNLAFHHLLTFPILAVYLEGALNVRLLVGVSIALRLPQATQEATAMIVERHWVSFPRGDVYIKNEFEAYRINQLKNFLLTCAKPGESALILPYGPNLNFLMGYRNANPVILLRPLSVPLAKLERAVPCLADSWIIHLNEGESVDFLLEFWPNADIAKYQSENALFHQQLLKTHELHDFGTLLVFRPLLGKPKSSPK